ncbi:MAG TPA: hypothetical protein VES88_12355 [Gemmatimonadaceae bacterium]|nr:hypothetical protein [Gemmatimonadaceae bacterium]
MSASIGFMRDEYVLDAQDIRLVILLGGDEKHTTRVGRAIGRIGSLEFKFGDL